MPAISAGDALSSYVEFHLNVNKDQYFVEETQEITPSVIANKIKIKGEHYVYVFTDKDRNHVFVGAMFDSSGLDKFKGFNNSVKAPSLKDFNTSKSFAELVKAVQYVDKSLKGIEFGNKDIKAVNAIVFINPNDPIAQSIWDMVKKSGHKFKYKIILVGSGSDDEIRTINAIYKSSSQYKSLDEWFNIYSKTRDSRIAFRNKGVGDPHPSLKKSNEIMKNLGIVAAPYFLLVPSDKNFYSGGINEAVINSFFYSN